MPDEPQGHRQTRGYTMTIDENRKYADKVRGAFPCITLPVQDVLHVEKRCTRCSGEGEIVHYMHVQRGICFACNGTTVVQYMVYRNSSYWTGYFDYTAGLESWHCPFATKSAERSWHMGHTAAFEQEYADNICLGRTTVETFPTQEIKVAVVTKHSRTYTGKCKLCPEQVERVGDELCGLCIDFATRAARGKCSLCATPTKSVGDEFCEQCAEFEGHQHLCECGREYIEPFEVRCSSCKYRL